MAQHFAQLLEMLRNDVAKMTSKVQHVVEQATQAMLSIDPELALEAIQEDERVDFDEVEVEKAAVNLLALYQPAAVDLRFITSVIKVNSDFERVADCAVNIAQRVPFLAEDRSLRVSADLQSMANAVVRTLRDTINAFNLSDVERARDVIRADANINALYHSIIMDSLQNLESRRNHASRNLAIVMIAKNYERIGDHCTNIAEDIVYITTGQIIRHKRTIE
jgi:phosphate transport system protein